MTMAANPLKPVAQRFNLDLNLLTGIVMGVLIAIVMHFAHGLVYFQKLEDSALDWMIGMYRGVPRAENTDRLKPLTFIDIDEATYRHWQEPLSVPRDKLLSLIRQAVDGGAETIVVDIDLTRPGRPEDDRALRDYLAEFRGGAAGNQHILLARGLRMPLERGGVIEQKQSFLDPALQGNPKIHWAAPLYQMAEDSVIRRWRLWETTCDRNSKEQHTVALPSFQLLAGVLAASNRDVAVINDLRGSLQAHVVKDCASPLSIPTTLRLTPGGLGFNIQQDKLGQRILYSMPWKFAPGEVAPEITYAVGPEKRQGRLLSTISAGVLTEHAAAQDADRERFAGHIVLIGASFAESRDIYMTPLGMMPGTLIIANAFLTFYQNGEPRNPPGWVKLLFEVVLIVALAIVFSKLKGYAAKFTGYILTLCVLLPTTFVLFRSGLWLDFAIPLTAVQIHALMSELEHRFMGEHH